MNRDMHSIIPKLQLVRFLSIISLLSFTASVYGQSDLLIADLDPGQDPDKPVVVDESKNEASNGVLSLVPASTAKVSANFKMQGVKNNSFDIRLLNMVVFNALSGNASIFTNNRGSLMGNRGEVSDNIGIEYFGGKSGF